MKTMTNLAIAAYKGKYRAQKEIDALFTALKPGRNS